MTFSIPESSDSGNPPGNTMSTYLIIDIGTSSIRVSVLTDTQEIVHEGTRPFLPDTPSPGLVEFDAHQMGQHVLDLCAEAIAATGTPNIVGVTNQRGSTVVWDRSTGMPVAPGQGWQDLRTVGDCLALQGSGLQLAPNMPAPKAKWILDQVDPDRKRPLAVGTIDSWIVSVLSGGADHVTDTSNAAVTGYWSESGWEQHTLEVLNLPESMLPTVVPSTGICATAAALSGAPPIGALIGDQQASMIGQGAVERGLAKCTFGTGGMLDVCLGRTPPTFLTRGTQGTFRIAAWQDADGVAHGLEAIMLSAGTCIEWLRDDLKLIPDAAASGEIAASVDHSDGVVFVPALLGLGTPNWDYGARGTLTGLTRGSTAAHIVRAVLEGVAHRGVDLFEAATADAGLELGSLRIDGGMSDNQTFVQILANLLGIPVEVSPLREATTLGASFLTGVALGDFESVEHTGQLWAPRAIVEPEASCSADWRANQREGYRSALDRAAGWIEGLSAIKF